MTIETVSTFAPSCPAQLPGVGETAIEQPASIPTSAEVQAAFDPSDTFAGEITDLAYIAAGEARIELVRFDWPNEEPVVGVRVDFPNEVEGDVLMDCNDNPDPAEAVQRLTELSTAASAAAQQLRALIATGAWK